MDQLKLIYVNELGINYLGHHTYEFIFGSEDCDPEGENWDDETSSEDVKPPNIKYIEKVGVLSNEHLVLNTVQKTDFFSVFDSVEGVIALAWEDPDTIAIIDQRYDRLVFRYGESEKSVSDKLFERDLVLKIDNQIKIH